MNGEYGVSDPNMPVVAPEGQEGNSGEKLTTEGLIRLSDQIDNIITGCEGRVKSAMDLEISLKAKQKQKERTCHLEEIGQYGKEIANSILGKGNKLHLRYHRYEYVVNGIEDFTKIPQYWFIKSEDESGRVVENIKDFTGVLQDWFGELAKGFKERKAKIFDPKREKKEEKDPTKCYFCTALDESEMYELRERQAEELDELEKATRLAIEELQAYITGFIDIYLPKYVNYSSGSASALYLCNVVKMLLAEGIEFPKRKDLIADIVNRIASILEKEKFGVNIEEYKEGEKGVNIAQIKNEISALKEVQQVLAQIRALIGDVVPSK